MLLESVAVGEALWWRDSRYLKQGTQVVTWQGGTLQQVADRFTVRQSERLAQGAGRFASAEGRSGWGLGCVSSLVARVK